MTCDEARELIEAVASGDIDAPPPLAAHVGSCQACAAALELARAIERSLASQPQPAAPQNFTRAVLGSIRSQRWEYDEHVDRAFNVALALGISLILIAIVGLLNVSALAGLLMAGADAVAALPQQSPAWSGVPATPMAGIGMTVVVTAIAIWWWAERRAGFERG